MIATVFDILDRPQKPARRAALDNFHLREQGQFPASIILENPDITLYMLDFEGRQAVFVETPVDVDLSHASFYFDTQYETAMRVWTIPFETMLQLAQAVPLDNGRFTFIHSVGRCGSTLASQIFAQVPGVINISEPHALFQLVIARNTKMAADDELYGLLDATVRLLCKTPAETAWVMKGHSFVIELGDWLHQLYPQTKNLFLYRHAETWLRSGLRAFGSGTPETAEETLQRDKQRRQFLGSLVPLIANYDPDRPLPHAGTLSLMWIRTMEMYVAYCEMGIEMLAIRYESWRAKPRETAAAMLEYCQCRPEDLTAVYATLNKDSQANTSLAQDTLGQHKRVLADSELAELKHHLQNHAFLNDANFEAPNTLR